MKGIALSLLIAGLVSATGPVLAENPSNNQRSIVKSAAVADPAQQIREVARLLRANDLSSVVQATVPPSTSGTETNSGCGPHTMRTSSLKNITIPKVASTWSRWSRRYRRETMDTSKARPTNSAAAMAAPKARANEPLAP